MRFVINASGSHFESGIASGIKESMDRLAFAVQRKGASVYLYEFTLAESPSFDAWKALSFMEREGVALCGGPCGTTPSFLLLPRQMSRRFEKEILLATYVFAWGKPMRRIDVTKMPRLVHNLIRRSIMDGRKSVKIPAALMGCLTLEQVADISTLALVYGESESSRR